MKVSNLRRLAQALSALVVAFVGLSGCGEDSSRLEALEHMATSGAVPAYESAAEAAGILAESVAQLCEEPSGDGLSLVSERLVQLRLALATTEPYRHGPAMDQRDEGRINTRAEPDAIEDLISSLDPEIFDANYVSTSIGASKRGLYALEYVFFFEGSESDTVESFQDRNRCTYVVALSAAVDENIVQTSSGWTRGGAIKPSYVEVLADPDHQQENIDTSVETSLFLLRKIINMELAPALGLVGLEPDLATLAEGQAGQGLPLLRVRLEAVTQAMAGPTGISELLSDGLRDRIRAELEAAREKIDEIEANQGPSMRMAASHSPADMTELHDLIMTVERTVSTELVGELGVVVGFSDADGDSAN